jgi:hypothetical protein
MEQLNLISKDLVLFPKSSDWFEGRATSRFTLISSPKTRINALLAHESWTRLSRASCRESIEPLACCRTVIVEGNDVYGAERECKVKVADVGPLLVLKLNAFGGPSERRLPKDAYDVLLAVTAFVDGPAAAIKGFQAEKAAGNPAYQIATAVLEKDFSQPEKDGPIRAAEFLGGSGANRDRVREDVVTVGRRLLGL